MSLTFWGVVVFFGVCGWAWHWCRGRTLMDDLDRWEAVRGTPADRHFGNDN